MAVAGKAPCGPAFRNLFPCSSTARVLLAPSLRFQQACICVCSPGQ
jgi:hypothetical protein